MSSFIIELRISAIDCNPLAIFIAKKLLTP